MHIYIYIYIYIFFFFLRAARFKLEPEVCFPVDGLSDECMDGDSSGAWTGCWIY